MMKPLGTVRRSRRAIRRAPAEVALLYGLVSGLWIVGSDRVVELLVPAAAQPMAQSLKGLAFVLLTSVMLYLFVARLRRMHESSTHVLEHSEESYRALFLSNPNPMWVYEVKSLRFLAVNEAAVARYGYQEAEFLAMTIQDIRPPEDRPQLQQALANLPSDGQLYKSGRFRHRTKSGRILEVDIHSHAVAFEGREARLVVALDVTESTLNEQQLKAANERLNRLSSRILEVQEKERRLIAQELHDEIGQALTAVKLHLQLFGRKLDNAAQVAKLNELVSIVEVALDQVRSLSLSLRPPHLDALGLEAALRWQIDRLFAGTDVDCQLDCVPLSPRPDTQVEATVFRIVQECLTNIVRHAQAHKVRVVVRVEGGKLWVQVTDDGQGFAMESGSLTERPSLGLAGMVERAKLLGGTVDIASVRGLGTQVQAMLPLQAGTSEVLS